MAEDADFDTQPWIMLGLLNAVHRRSDVTQRSLSHDLNIALGLANVYVRRCIKKGWIKIQQVPSNRYAYYLTPHGFAQKALLTGDYFRQSFNLFRQARAEYDEIARECALRNWRYVALLGGGELGEVALLSFSGDVKAAGFVDPQAEISEILNFPVVAELSQLPIIDGVVVTAPSVEQSLYDAVVAQVGIDRVVMPKFLQFVRLGPLGPG
ncbi:winged helix-turn-helix transcriptional regulator [Magnetospirillum gryphiswaldense]|uniref:MarR family transcriptional regulator n=1 Tax=Magnetospirillum gryphiswaldense TaxID=55518 RepID=A4U187_9PROT|nr:winged helix-turn-helix transcriptional regulator [Magnetospirillum gryphiswaldense]AVM75575.1 hypothetical protein MSR1_31090 [Magnetospirillum gryphiswaldense MSR-1]AVM79478.1 hypothetical protein MSR1L_31090 [Magnetospirillum gryphiswaldense]CAM76644.1 conserved hypothetical protein [Magnetospirillum gryphiswaldense MSR-1]